MFKMHLVMIMFIYWKKKKVIISSNVKGPKGEPVAVFLTYTAAVSIILHRLYMRLQLIFFVPDIDPLIFHDLLKGKNRKSDRVNKSLQDPCKLNKTCYQLRWWIAGHIAPPHLQGAALGGVEHEEPAQDALTVSRHVEWHTVFPPQHTLTQFLREKRRLLFNT